MPDEIQFRSLDATLRGTLYRCHEPNGPAVVMAHGFSATRRMTIDRFAEAISAAGFNVLAFDHRGFGDSGGLPRQEVNPWVQARGYIDAITCVKGLGDIDPSRIAAWGYSNSAGIASVVTALDRRVKAVVLQNPSLGEQSPVPDPHGHGFNALANALRSDDVISHGRPIVGPLAVVSADQSQIPSALKPVSAYRWLNEYGDRPGTLWRNEVKIALGDQPIRWQPGLSGAHIEVPILMIVSPEDEMPRSVPAVAREVFEACPGEKTWHSIAGGHFGCMFYPGDLFDEAVGVQISFLRGVFS